MNPAPVLRLRGRLHTDLVTEDVPAYEGRDSYRDEAGTFRRAVEPRPAYSMTRVTVITDGGGFVEVTMRDESLTAAQSAGWSLPVKGDEIDVPVRPYLQWAGPDGRRFQAIRMAFAGDVLASDLTANGSKRPALASTGS